jgi:hypothetical protein
MSIAMTVISITDPPGQLRVAVNLAFTGSYPTGGDTLDLTTIIGLGHLSKVAVFNNLPVDVDVALGGGYDGEFLPGSALNNGKLKLFSSGGTELGAGAYSSGAALLSASLNNTIEFVFDKLL